MTETTAARDAIAHCLLMGRAPYASPQDYADAVLKRLAHDGFAVVPVEPTEEMMAAVDCAGEKRSWPSGQAWISGWQAMVKAANGSDPKAAQQIKQTATVEAIKRRIEVRLNDYLVEMRPGHDDSITGFNEAWDIVRKAFAEAMSDPADPTKCQQGSIMTEQTTTDPEDVSWARLLLSDEFEAKDAEIASLRATIETWCTGQLGTNDQILAAVTLIQDKINEDIITEINDPRNAVEVPAFRSGLRVARCIVNRVIGEKDTAKPTAIPEPPTVKLEQELDAWIEREFGDGSKTPDFWDDLNTSERVAHYLVGLGYRKVAVGDSN